MSRAGTRTTAQFKLLFTAIYDENQSAQAEVKSGIFSRQIDRRITRASKFF